MLFLCTNCFAAQENFDASSATQNVVLCTNSITTNSIYVKNTGDVESNYILSATGDASWFTTYSEGQFSLKPGESKLIFVYYAPGNNQGTYDLETKIKTGFGVEKTVKHSIQAKNCPNIQLDVKTPSLKSNPCQPSQFIFNVKNIGDYTDTFLFGIKGLEGYTALSAGSAILAPQQSIQVDLFVNPDCSIYGQKELTFQTLASASQFLAEANVALDIERNYDYAAVVPSTISICNLKQTAIPVAFANNVPFTNQYDISVKGPSWLGQEAERVELSGYGTGITNLVANPANPGSYLADVIVKSIRGDVVKGGALNITVEKCYLPEVNIKEPSDVIISGHLTKYSIEVKNSGTKQDTYSFELSAPEWVSADALKSTLKPGETKTFTLTAKANATGNYDVVLRLISEETKTAKDDLIKLKVISPEDAYKLDMSAKTSRVLYGTGQVIVQLNNKGILPATYDLTLQGPKWISLPGSKVTLQPGEKGQLILPTNVKKTEQLADYEVAIVATVGKEVGFVSKFTLKLRELTFWQEMYVFTVTYWLYLTIGAVVIIILLLLAIFGRRMARAYRNYQIKERELAKIRSEQYAKRRAEEQARRLLTKSARKPSNVGKVLFGIFMIILALALLAGAAIYVAGYAPIVQELLKPKKADLFEPIIKVDTTGLEAYGNVVIIRNLKETNVPIIIKNNYKDTLVFGVETGTSWIKTNTKQVELAPKAEEKVTFRIIPDENIKGIYKIKVSAELTKDNKKFNEDITLNIKQQSLWQDVLDFIWYIAGGIAVLIVGIIIAKLSSKKQKKQKDEQDGKIEFSKIKYKPMQKSQISLSKKK